MNIDTAQYRKYKGYSLMEMLVVMSIIIIIMGIGFGTFAGLHSSISLSEDIATLIQDVKNAQRSAMFIERRSTERWLYGIGLDFSRLESDGYYRMFKWCSPFDEYGDILTQSSFPNYDPGFSVSLTNGTLRTTNAYTTSSCPTGSPESRIISFEGYTRNISNNLYTFNRSTNPSQDVGGTPVYLLFESVSGKAFMYDSDGVLVNYDTDGNLINDRTKLVIGFRSKTVGVERGLTIDNISGRVSEYKQ
jgi:type II secretory pathway pseudopilin PulG